MAERLGIEHLTDLSAGEAIAAFFTPLIIFAVFFVLQVILPARRVPGYVKDRHPGNLWAWTYSIFVVSFFTVRQRFDERACEQKYGPEKWAEYQARVKYRIFPGIY